MRILVACEFSGIVRDAFRAIGHDAWSCDLLPCEANPQFHLQGDVREHVGEDGRGEYGKWECLIAFPPCTHLASSGARWFKEKQKEQSEAVAFVKWLDDLPIPHRVIENPIGVLSTRFRKPDQIIQPWQFGHGETKATCLWLHNVAKLKPTNIVGGRVPRVHYASPGPDRWRERSRTLPGIASAMADQWGKRYTCFGTGEVAEFRCAQ